MKIHSLCGESENFALTTRVRANLRFSFLLAPIPLLSIQLNPNSCKMISKAPKLERETHGRLISPPFMWFDHTFISYPSWIILSHIGNKNNFGFF